MPHAEAAERKARTGTETERSFGKVITFLLLSILQVVVGCYFLFVVVVAFISVQAVIAAVVAVVVYVGCLR